MRRPRFGRAMTSDERDGAFGHTTVFLRMAAIELRHIAERVRSPTTEKLRFIAAALDTEAAELGGLRMETSEPTAPAGSTVVLVVDDDPDVLFMASTALSIEGFTVVEASNGADAIGILRERPEIDVLFTDIVMPGEVDGFELAHLAKQLRPELRVLYTSGYIRDIPWGQKGVGYGPLLPKPWRQDQLSQIVHALVQESTRPPGSAQAPQ